MKSDFFGKVFCKLGVHSWGKPIRTSHGFSSNVYDVKRTCTRCSKVKKYVEHK